MSHKYYNWKAYGSLHFRTKSFFLCNKPKPMNNGFPLVALLTFCVRAIGLGPAANLGESRWTTNVLKTNRGNHTRSPCRENKKSGRTHRATGIARSTFKYIEEERATVYERIVESRKGCISHRRLALILVSCLYAPTVSNRRWRSQSRK